MAIACTFPRGVTPSVESVTTGHDGDVEVDAPRAHCFEIEAHNAAGDEVGDADLHERTHLPSDHVVGEPSKMLGGASQTVSKIRVKCNGT